jgi:hypothetical protein
LRRRRAALVLLDTGWSRRQAAHTPLLDASTQQCNSRSLADPGQGVAQRRAGDAHQAQVGVIQFQYQKKNALETKALRSREQRDGQRGQQSDP